MAQTTVQELVYAALRISGVVTGAGRAASTEQNADGLVSLNRMLSSWSIARSHIYQTQTATYPLASQQSYTIGKDPAGILTADFDAPRPNRIERAAVWLDSLRLPVHVMTDEEWDAIKLQGLQGSFPTRIYCDYAAPFATITVWPVPGNATSLELRTWTAFSEFAALDDAAFFPDGYEEAITYNLAVRLAALFRTQLTPEAVAIARESLARVQAHNAPSPLMSCDSAVLPSSRSGSWNWMTGDLV
jgi:hypothetical protein